MNLDPTSGERKKLDVMVEGCAHDQGYDALAILPTALQSQAVGNAAAGIPLRCWAVPLVGAPFAGVRFLAKALSCVIGHRYDQS